MDEKKEELENVTGKYLQKLNQLKLKNKTKFEEFAEKFQNIKNKPLDLAAIKRYSNV